MKMESSEQFIYWLLNNGFTKGGGLVQLVHAFLRIIRSDVIILVRTIVSLECLDLDRRNKIS
jgi:hypothetical protein